MTENEEKKLIINRIKFLLEKADYMEPEFREGIFLRVTGEYLEAHVRSLNINLRRKKTR